MKIEILIPTQWVEPLRYAALKNHRSPSGEVMAAVEEHLVKSLGEIPQLLPEERGRVGEVRVAARVMRLCSGPDGETEGVILNRCRSVGKDEMAEILADLVRRGKLTAETCVGRGRPSVRYRTNG